MDLQIEYVNKRELKPYANNAKIHTAEQIEQIKASIAEFGMNDPIAVWHDNEVVEGHGRLLALMEMDEITQVPIIRLDALTDEQRRAYMLAHNKLTMNTDFDVNLLDIELDDITDIDMSLFGFDITEGGLSDFDEPTTKLADDFIIPPFDIFDARSRAWLDRKKEWNDKIGDLAQARSDAKAYSNKATNDKDKYKGNGVMPNETSILDPVLSEIVCKWFTPKETSFCFDCFAGDTVFGYVAGTLGHTFTGIELRQEQADFNNERTDGLDCVYICDDGQNVAKHIEKGSQDLLFSCPPYYDLEVYSDMENDASNQGTYEEFYQILDNAFTDAIDCLADNRFAVIVCGDIRDKKTGAYYNFPNDIINTFTRNGMMLYNNIKLLTPIGTAQIRARKYMKYRKTAHIYQDVLVFYKGDPKKIKDEFPEIKVAEVDADESDDE